MLVKCGIGSTECENISHSVTLVPRLAYSMNLLGEIIHLLDVERNTIKQSNLKLLSDFNDADKIHLKALQLEQTMLLSLDILLHIQTRTQKISGISSIPEVFPSVIPMMRIVSAQLFDIMPQCSQKLSELSVHLGSIVLDSAALTKARFDFSQSNEESMIFLDEVKLMVDSKLSKQYPNLDFFRVLHT